MFLLAFDFDFGFAGFFLGGGVAGVFEVIGQLQAQISGVGGVGEGRFKIHLFAANHFFDFAVEVLHAFGVAVAHGVEERLAFGFAFFDVFAGAHGGFENFDGGDAALVVFPGEQALRNNIAESFGQTGANGLLIGKRKNADNALDGFRSVDGMQRGHDQMSSFRGFEGDFNRFAVAHFAYENDFGRLAQRGAQGQSKAGRVGMKFALVNGAFFVAVQKF